MITLEELYPKFIHVYLTVMKITSFIGVLVSLCAILIIYFRTPLCMGSFKPLLLLYTMSQFFFELAQLLYEPIGLRLIAVTYPRGLLSPMKIGTSKAFLLFLIFDFLTMNVLLVMMLINRYFAMRNSIPKIRKVYEYPIFYYVILTALLVFSLPFGIYFIYYSSFFRTTEDTAKMIRENIIGGEQLLAWQPSLLSANVDTPIRPIPFIFFSSVMGIVVLFFIIFFVLCICKLKTSFHEFSLNAKALHIMLLKCVLLQCLTTMSTMTSCVGALVLSLLLRSSSITQYVAFFFAWALPIVDCSFTIVVITPYREFVLQFLSTILSRKSKQDSGISMDEIGKDRRITSQ